MTDTWAVIGPDNTVHYRREVGYENPNMRARVFAEARHHAKRTGHKVIVDRHSRFTLEAGRNDHAN